MRKPGDYDEDDSKDDDDAGSELSRVRKLTGEDGEGDDEDEDGEDERWRDFGRDEDLIRYSHRCHSPWMKDRPLKRCRGEVVRRLGHDEARRREEKKCFGEGVRRRG